MAKEPTENISITVPMYILPILDMYCGEHDLSRSQTVNRAIRLYLGTKKAKDPEFWQQEYQRLQKEGKI